MAEQAGLDPSYLAKVEAGKRVLSLDALVRLAESLKTPVSGILRVVKDVEEGDSRKGYVEEIVVSLNYLNEEQLNLVRDFCMMLQRRSKDN